LSYTPKLKSRAKHPKLYVPIAGFYPRDPEIPANPRIEQWIGCASFDYRNYSMILVTTPEPTVLPPSRIAKRTPSSIATVFCSSTITRTLSPGMHISAPTSSAEPVTSVVRK